MSDDKWILLVNGGVTGAKNRRTEDDEDWYLGTKASETLLFLLFTQLNIGMVVFFFWVCCAKNILLTRFFSDETALV